MFPVLLFVLWSLIVLCFGMDFTHPLLKLVMEDLETYVHRIRHAWAPLPLPPNIVPTGGAPLADCSDEDLLNCPPSVLAHIISTAANGGAQVLSPRRVNLAGSVNRYVSTDYRSDVIIAGSIASDDLNWPTFDRRDTSGTYPSQPLRAATGEPAPVKPVQTESVSTGLGRLCSRDPASSAIRRMCGLIDLQKRADIAGSYWELAALMDHAWGFPAGTCARMTLYSAAPSGDLLRYLLSADSGSARLVTSVQVARTLSVYSGMASRADWGPDTAYDWAAAKVAAGFSFLAAVRLEGHSMVSIGARVTPAPGSRGAPLDTPGWLVFTPAVGSIGYYAPSTCRIDVRPDDPTDGHGPGARPPRSPFILPTEVKLKVAATIEAAKVVVRGTTGVRQLKRAVAARVEGPANNTLMPASLTIVRAVAARAARGKTYGRLFRDVVSKLLDERDDIVAAGFARTVLGALEAFESSGVWFSHVMLAVELAPLYTGLTARFLQLLPVEATMAGKTVEEATQDFNEMLPTTLRITEPTIAQVSQALAYTTIRDSEQKMRSALRRARGLSVANAGSGIMQTFALRAAEGEVPFMHAVCSACVKPTRTFWASMYHAEANAGDVIMNIMATMGYPMVRAAAQLGKLLWRFRAEAARTVSFSVTDTEPAVAPHATLIEFPGGWVKVYMAPYVAYIRLRNCMASDPALAGLVDMMPERVAAGKVSSVLGEIVWPGWLTGTMPGSTLTRYVDDMTKLEEAMESMMGHVSDDIMAAAVIARNTQIGSRAMPPEDADGSLDVAEEVVPFFTVPVRTFDTGWSYKSASGLTDDQYDELEATLDEGVLERLMNSRYGSAEEFMAAVLERVAAYSAATAAPTEGNTLA